MSRKEKRGADESVALADFAEEDAADLAADGEDGEEQFEEMLEENRRISTVWTEGGKKKDEVLRKLIKLFGSLVIKFEDDDDGMGLKKIYQKLPNAHKSVLKARVLLRESENFDTRDFTIFVSKKKWIRNELAPLMELSTEDRDLTMKCCRLMMILIKGLRDNVQKSLKTEIKEKQGKETKEEALERFEKETRVKANAREQVTSLLSFKEALSTEKCCLAVTNVFAYCWKKETNRDTRGVDTKEEVAVVLSYLRRMLQIDTSPKNSSPADFLQAKQAHHSLIVNMRSILLTVPSICAEIMDKYHDDWLNDIILIVFHALKSFDAKDMFKVWKEKCIISQSGLAPSSSSSSSDAANANNTSTSSSANNKSTFSEQHQQHNSSAVTITIPRSLSSRGEGASKGLLGGILERERAERAKKIDVLLPRQGRFGGTYRITPGSSGLLPLGPPPGAAGSQTDDTCNDDADRDGDDGEPDRPNTVIKRSLLGSAAAPALKIQAKRNKKTITFVQADPEAAFIRDVCTQDSQRACVVAATMADRICVGLGLKQLVIRVNEDLRKDEHRVGIDTELRYFQTLSTLLRYNRLKLAYDKGVFEANAFARHNSNYDVTTTSAPATGIDDTDGSAGWVPDLKNMINALDKMSFARVLHAMEKLHTKDKRFSDVVTPMELYKEMICYLRIMLESANVDQNDIAVATLYRIFYTGSEKQDPLPRLLREWKTGPYFERKHLNVLVELVHETLKTLETARNRYGGDSSDGSYKKRKAMKGKKELNVDLFIANCIAFNVDEYFKKLVSTHTVFMYTKLLAGHATNDAATNHYAYVFLQRMNSMRLEQDCKFRSLPELASNPKVQKAIESSDLTLGNMLFNIYTLSVFGDILSDAHVLHNKTMEPLVRLIRSVVRKFGEAAQKNRLLLVEAMFNHAHAQEHCVRMDSVYEAPSYASNYYEPKHTYSRYDDSSDDDEYDEKAAATTAAGTADVQQQQEQQQQRLQKKKSSAADDLGEEIDEMDFEAAAAHAASEKERKLKEKAKARKQKRREKEAANGHRKKKEKRSNSSRREKEDKDKGEEESDADAATSGDDDDADADDSDDNDNGSDNDEKGRVERERIAREKKDKQVKLRQRKEREERARGAAWGGEEEAVLRKLYAQYAGSESVFDVIAVHPDLMAFGQDRTVAQIERRVQELALYLEVNRSDDDEGDVDNNNATDQIGDKSSRKPLKLDDDDDDDEQVESGSSNMLSWQDRMKAFDESDDEEEVGKSSLLRKRQKTSSSNGGDGNKKKKLQKKSASSRMIRRRTVGGVSDSDDDLFGGDDDKVGGDNSDGEMDTGARKQTSVSSSGMVKSGLLVPVSRARAMMIDSDDEL